MQFFSEIFILILFIDTVLQIVDCHNEIHLYPKSFKLHYPFLRMQLVYKNLEIQTVDTVTCLIKEENDETVIPNDMIRHRRSVKNNENSNSASDDYRFISETPETIYLSPVVPEPLTHLPNVNVTDELSHVRLNLPFSSANEKTDKLKSLEGNNDTEAKDIPVYWRLKPNSFTFEAGLFMEILELTYVMNYNTSIEGKLNITCQSNASLQMTTTSLITFELIPITPSTLTPEERIEERYFPYPEYIDLAPCPCDLTQKGCDMDCCCDTDCDLAMLHNCSLERQKRNQLVDLECSSASDIFLCIEYNNSPFIDTFYSVRSIIRTLREFSEKVSAHLDELPWFLSLPHHKAYMKGIPMKIYTGSQETYWKLPSRLFSKKCNSKAIVHFGQEFSSECLSEMNADQCSANSNFAINSFVDVSQNEEGNATFSASVPSELHKSDLAVTSVLFYCIQNNFLYFIERSKYERLEDVLISDDGVLQPCMDVSDYVPSLNEENVCKNMVSEVHYLVEWNGSSVSHVHIWFVLMNVSLQINSQAQNQADSGERFKRSLDDPLELSSNDISNYHVTQRFSVSFQHTPVSDDETKYNSLILRNKTISIPYWSKDATGYCLSKSSLEMKTGESMLTSCWLNVPTEASGSCATFRRYLCDSQQHLFEFPTLPASVFLTKNESLCDGKQINLTSCQNLPTQVHLEILYAEQTVQSIPSSLQILGINISYIAVPCLPCIGVSKDNCENFASLEDDGISSPIVICKPVRKVTLTHTINSIRANIHSRTVTKKYWYHEDSWYCHFFICWNDFIYPFSELNDSDELLAYPALLIVIGVSVGIIAFVVSFCPY